MNREKYPEWAQEFDALAEQKQKILDEVAPLEKQAAPLRAEADKAEAAWQAVRAQVAKIEKDKNLRGISMRMAALARAMGARSIKAEGRGAGPQPQ